MPLMIYCTAALTSFSNSISYITYLCSEWRIEYGFLSVFSMVGNIMLYSNFSYFTKLALDIITAGDFYC